MMWQESLFLPWHSIRSTLNLVVCFIPVPILIFKNSASASLILLNCVDIPNISVFSLRSDEMFAMVANSNCRFFSFMLGSAAPFVTEGFSKLILYLMVPFVVIVNYLLNKNVVSVNFPAHSQRPREVSDVKKSLREIFKESYRLIHRLFIDYSSKVFMEHVNYIKEFCWQLLQHSIAAVH